jgi:hypothetical protein
MARISTYNKAVPVVAEDKWIGSDSQNQMRTRNFTAQDVANFINKKGGEDQNLRYTYNDTTGYLTGSIAFANGGAANVPLNSITTFNIGAFDLRSPTLNLGDWITTALLNSDVLLTQCDDLNNWAIYSWDSAVVTGVKGEYQIGLSFRAGSGSLIADEDYFISLLSYAGEGDLHFTYVQGVAATTWNIQHNLGKFPSITVIDTANTVVTGEYTYDDINNVTLTFSAGFAGKAYLN